MDVEESPPRAAWGELPSTSGGEEAWRSNGNLLARVGDAAGLRALLTRDGGWECDARDNRGWTPLHEAVFARNHTAVRLILQLGRCVDVDASAHDGLRPLHLAASGHSLPIVRSLLGAGATVDATTPDLLRPLQAGISETEACVPVVTALLKAGADPNAAYWNSWRPLHEAASKGNAAVVRALVAAGAEPAALDEEGLSPVFTAALYGFDHCLRALLEKATYPQQVALVNLTTTRGHAPLHACGSKGSEACVRTLLKAGAEVNVLDQDGVHPIVELAQNNFTRCLRLVLPLTDVGLVRSSPVDPVMDCAETPSPEALQLLVEAGLDVDRASPLICDLRPSMHAFLHPLLSRRRLSTPLGRAVSKHLLPNVEVLLRAGASPTQMDPETFCPLSLAILKPRGTETLEAFLKAGTDVNSVTDGSLVPVPDALLFSLAAKNKPKLLLLLRAGLRPRLRAWCACSRTDGYSLLQELRGVLPDGELVELVSLLRAAEPQLPRCCDEWGGMGGGEVAGLKELSRAAVRATVRSRTLFESDEWVTRAGLPPKLIPFLTLAEIVKR